MNRKDHPLPASAGSRPGESGKAPAIAGPSPALPAVDVRRLVGDISRTFNPLARDFELDTHVEQLPGGMVQVSVVLPQGMTRAFVALLESLTGFVRLVDHKSRCSAAEVKVIDPDEVENRRQAHETYRSQVCALFDGFTAEGCDRKEAVSRTNQAMKAKGHPWATLDLVSLTLRDAGRLRGRPREEPPTGGSRRPRG